MKASRRHIVVGAVTAVGLAVAAPALAYLCHRDPAGTRVLFVHGSIDEYSAAGTRITFGLHGPQGCRTAVWDAKVGTVNELRSTCARREPARLLASRQQTTIEPGGPMRPPILNVWTSGRLTHRWPLPAPARTLAVFGGVGVFSSAGGGGLYGIRLADGHIGLIGPNRPADNPRLTRAGVFYQDDEFKQDRKQGIVRLKFVPSRGIAAIIDRAQRPLLTSGRIAGLSMDGPRVALAVADPSRVCDRVLYWNVAWRPVQRISAANGPTCVLGRHTVISRIAVGGFRAAWLRSSGSEQAIIAGSPRCQEWVIRRLRTGPGGDTVSAVVGDGKVLSFAITRHQRELRGTSEIGVISGGFRAVDIASRAGVPENLAVDGRRVAILWDDGVVEIRGLRGRLLQKFELGSSHAIALSGGSLLALRDGRLDSYSLRSGERVAVWAVAPDVTALDVQYRVAILHSGRVVYGLDLDSGRSAVLGRAPSAIVDAQIEAAGLAYAYNVHSGGIGRFVPMAAVEQALDTANQRGRVRLARSRG
jgi:hypothetical protein